MIDVPLLDSITRFRAEYDALYYENDWFSTVDFEVYYALICHFQPQWVIEIGAGHSTKLALRALDDNRYGGIIAIDPGPRLTLPFHERLTYLASKVADVPVTIFDVLGPDDILFIDSSHIDVEYEYDMILPRIKEGVIVHIHDVFLPDDYPVSWRDRLFTEQERVAQLLSTGDWEVLWSSHDMHVNHADLLREAFLSYRTQTHDIGPSSLWLRRRERRTG